MDTAVMGLRIRDSCEVWPVWAIFEGLVKTFCHEIGPNIWQLIGYFYEMSLLVETTVAKFLAIFEKIGLLLSTTYGHTVIE